VVLGPSDAPLPKGKAPGAGSFRRLAAVVAAGNLIVTPEFRRTCRRHRVAVMASAQPPRRLLTKLAAYIRANLAVETSVHGVLLEIFGVGVLILGPSGIGKSECAMDLVMRGHRLVADDLIFIRRVSGQTLVGRGPELAGYHMEIRGLGIINIKDLFGVAAIMASKKIDLVVRLESWNNLQDYDRLGLEEQYHEILNVRLPYNCIPVSPGRNITAILEVAARNFLLRRQGYHTAKELEANLAGRLEREARPAPS
jgi:HPr kinase/phosphorylase